MKNLKRVLSLLIVILLLPACDSFLSQEAPSVVTQSEFWGSPSPAAAEQGVAAIYDEAQSTFQGRTNYAEFRADNFTLQSGPSTSDIQILNNDLDPNTNGSSWGSFYEGIATSNIAISNIADMSDFDKKDDLLAQAYAMRALFYFWATRIWGDIPKITEPILEFSEDLQITRSPSAEIFNEIIIPDLQRAEELVTTPRNQNVMSLGPILALKAHVYAWPGNHQDYTLASNTIDDLEGMGYELENTQEGWINIFRGEPQDSDEIIFSLAWDYNEDGANGEVNEYMRLAPFWIISSNLRETWDPNSDDFRRDISFIELDEDAPDNPDWYVLTKYAGGFDEILDRGQWVNTNEREMIFFRLSGLLLLKAEAENNLGNPSAALSLLNRVRSARGLDNVDESISDQETIRDMILQERRFELLGEAHRFWDLVRNDVVTEVMGPINGWEDETTIYWPVAQEVMDRNPQITQTEGY